MRPMQSRPRENLISASWIGLNLAAKPPQQSRFLFVGFRLLDSPNEWFTRRCTMFKTGSELQLMILEEVFPILVVRQLQQQFPYAIGAPIIRSANEEARDDDLIWGIAKKTTESIGAQWRPDLFSKRPYPSFSRNAATRSQRRQIVSEANIQCKSFSRRTNAVFLFDDFLTNGITVKAYADAIARNNPGITISLYVLTIGRNTREEFSGITSNPHITPDFIQFWESREFKFSSRGG